MKRVKSFPIVTDEEDIVADVAAVRDQAKKATKKAAKKGKDTAVSLLALAVDCGVHGCAQLSVLCAHHPDTAVLAPRFSLLQSKNGVAVAVMAK